MGAQCLHFKESGIIHAQVIVDEGIGEILVDDTDDATDLHTKCDEVYGKALAPNSFVQLMTEELNKVKKLCRSANYNNNGVDLMKPLVCLRELSARTWLLEVIIIMDKSGFLRIQSIPAIAIDSTVLDWG